MWRLYRYNALGDMVDRLQHQLEKLSVGAMSLGSIVGIQPVTAVVPDGCRVACTLEFGIAGSSHCISTAVSTASSSAGAS